MNDTPDTSIVVGARHGLGRGIAAALAHAGVPVVAVARTADTLSVLASETGGVELAVADATDATLTENLIERHDPSSVVVVAGASPVMRPLHEQTWETFSVNWHADVQIAFRWLRASLLKPLRPGSRVIVISSGAALGPGSPLSGGYAGAKATQRFITNYAQEESDRADLGITFTAVFPGLTPFTGLGKAAVEAYAARGGQSEPAYVKRLPEPVTPEGAGAAVLELIRRDTATLAPGYVLTGDGLQKLG